MCSASHFCDVLPPRLLGGQQAEADHSFCAAGVGGALEPAPGLRRNRLRGLLPNGQYGVAKPGRLAFGPRHEQALAGRPTTAGDPLTDIPDLGPVKGPRSPGRSVMLETRIGYEGFSISPYSFP